MCVCVCDTYDILLKLVSSYMTVAYACSIVLLSHKSLVIVYDYDGKGEIKISFRNKIQPVQLTQSTLMNTNI